MILKCPTPRLETSSDRFYSVNVKTLRTLQPEDLKSHFSVSTSDNSVTSDSFLILLSLMWIIWENQRIHYLYKSHNALCHCCDHEQSYFQRMEQRDCCSGRLWSKNLLLCRDKTVIWRHSKCKKKHVSSSIQFLLFKLESGAIMWPNCEALIQFISQWYKVLCSDLKNTNLSNLFSFWSNWG